MSQPSHSSDVYFRLCTTAPESSVRMFREALVVEVRYYAHLPEELELEEPATEERVRYPRQRLAATEPYRPEARVLVPLYTREFLVNPPTAFTQACAALADPARRRFLHPVLWDGLPIGVNVPGLAQAQSLGDGIDEYADLGLLSMCLLRNYVRDFKIVVERLAVRIVEAAENPGRAPVWESASVPPLDQTPPEPRFTIWVLSPRGPEWTLRDIDADNSVARIAARAAADLRLPSHIVDYASEGVRDDELLRTAGIALLDPRALDDEATRPAAELILRDPPPFAPVVLVIGPHGPPDDARTAQLAGKARALAGRPLEEIHVRVARDPDRVNRQFHEELAKVIQRVRQNHMRGFDSAV